MSIRKLKYLLLFVTALLLLVVLFLYIIGNKRNRETVSQDTVSEKPEERIAGERISRVEAIRLLSFFFYTEEEREALTKRDGFSDLSGTWYESYVNAALHAGFLLPTGKKLSGEGMLTCGEFRDMLERVCERSGIGFRDLMLQLPERLRTVKNRDELLLTEFLHIYSLCMEALLDKAGDRRFRMERTSILVLSIRKENENTVFVTETGDILSCGRFQDYSDLFGASKDAPRQSNRILSGNTVGQGSIRERRDFRGYPNAEDYRYEHIELLLCGREPVFFIGRDEAPVTIPNALIVYGSEDTLDCFINGEGKKLRCAVGLTDPIEKQVADITIKDRRVSELLLKPDTIHGKVLLTDSGQVEVEGYGRLPLQKDYRIYKLYGEYSMEPTNSILVGYSNVTFVVEGSEICAALITEAIRAENIRVLLSVDKTSNYLHRAVSVSSKDGFITTRGDTVTAYAPGETVSFSYEELAKTGERVIVTPQTESGKISVLSLKRSYGTPCYRGALEIAPWEDGLTLVNELPIEEYLYSVVPSEMPVSHGEEALKVQAVCARSYAYQQLLLNRYAKYGAHVDDTVNCQVYNNVAETDSSIFAVKDTYGKVMKHKDSVVTAFYFSTSSGFTSSIEEVWQNYAPTEYFSGRLQLTEDSGKALLQEAKKRGVAHAQGSDADAMEQLLSHVDLSEEETFRSFIRDEELKILYDGQELKKRIRTYDSGFQWYRWSVTLSAAQASRQLDRLLSKRIAENPKDVLTLLSHEGSFVTEDGAELSGRYGTANITTVGRVLGIEPVSRAKSGMLTELLIRGTANTVLVRNQTNIRTLLSPVDTQVMLANDATAEGISLMPSAFFYIEPGQRDGETVFVFRGGGYGHGVGMSQNGVKSLSEAGYGYEEILKHYYKGIVIGFIY